MGNTVEGNCLSKGETMEGEKEVIPLARLTGSCGKVVVEEEAVCRGI